MRSKKPAKVPSLEGDGISSQTSAADQIRIDLGFVSSRELDILILGLQYLPQTEDVKQLLGSLRMLRSDPTWAYGGF